MRRFPRILFRLTLMVLAAGISAADLALAQGYTRLQVLLPGEIEAPGTATGKLGVPDEQTVGTPFTARVRACDDAWNTVGSVTNLVSILSTDETATLPGDTQLVAGQAQVSVTLNAAGSHTFSAQDLVDGTIALATSANVTARVLQGFEFSRINQKNQNAGVAMSITLTAVDPTGQTVTGFSGQVALQELTSFGDGRIDPEVVQLSDGTWSGNVTMFRADETAINRGNVNIYAFLPSDPTRNGTSDPFTVHPGTFSRVQIVVPGQTAAPGSVSGLLGSPASHGADEPFQVVVYATDSYWNPIPSGDTVRITSNDGAASTPVTGAMTNGVAQLTLSLGTVGTQTLTVADLTNGSIQGMTTALIPVISGFVDQFVVEPIASPVSAGTPVSVTIRAADSAGNTIPGYTGDAILSANTGPGSISPNAITFSNGVWTGNIEFRGAGGAVSLSCADYASPPHTGTSAPFEVLAGDYVGVQVLLPGETPAGGTGDGVAGVADDQSAGSSFNVSLRAVDAFWNRVMAIDNRIALSSSDPYADLPTDAAFANGLATIPVTVFAAGLQTITGSDADSLVAEHTSNEVLVTPGSYARMVLVAPGENLAPGTAEGRDGAATDQSISFAFTVTVHATDTWGNPVGGVSDVVRITSGDPLAELPPDEAMVDGRADMVVRLSTGGFQQITAENVTQPGIASSTTQVRAISSGLHLEASITPVSVQAGEPFSLTVQVTNDAGSVIQEINSFVDVVVRNASTQDPGRGTLLNARFQLLQGERTISQTYTFAEDIVLVVTDDAGNQPAETDVLSVSPGPPFAIQMSANPSWVRGNRRSTVQAQVVDAFDNGVPAQPVDFEVTLGQGTLTPVDLETDPTGVARADFLAPRQPEMGTVRALSGALSAELQIETALVDPNAAGGSVTNYPNPFHPGETPTTIAYKLDDDADVRLRLYTLTGSLVFQEQLPSGGAGAVAGLNEFVWDGRNGDGEIVASGGYILLIEAEGGGETLHVMRRKIGVVR